METSAIRSAMMHFTLASTVASDPYGSENSVNHDHLVIMNLRLIDDRGGCHEVNCWLVLRRPEPHFIGTGILRGLAHLPI